MTDNKYIYMTISYTLPIHFLNIFYKLFYAAAPLADVDIQRLQAGGKEEQGGGGRQQVGISTIGRSGNFGSWAIWAI